MIEIPPLPKTTILLVEVGSTAHGTGIPNGEDHDESGIVVELPDQVLGLEGDFKNVMHRTQPEGSRSGPGDIDRNLYSLRNFITLAAGGNPSILQMMWSPVLFSTTHGEQLRNISSAFVGRHIIPRYSGYMQSQTLRLLGLRGGGHGKRGGGQREELVQEFGYDTKYAMHAARLGYQCLELLSTGELKMPIEDPYADWLRDVRHGRVPFEDLWDRLLELDKKLFALRDDTSIPEEPDRKLISATSVAIHQEIWSSNAF